MGVCGVCVMAFLKFYNTLPALMVSAGLSRVSIVTRLRSAVLLRPATSNDSWTPRLALACNTVARGSQPAAHAPDRATCDTQRSQE